MVQKKKGYEREEILPEEIDGKEERDTERQGGKVRGEARIEWASIEPRILPSTHTADECRAGSPKCFSGVARNTRPRRP